jgi:RAB protein geranylgeranyltransferase component A
VTLQKEHFAEFMKRTGVSSPKLIKMVAYCLCNFRINPDLYKEYTKDSEELFKKGINIHGEMFEDQSSKEMLRRLNMFVESLNVQSKLPYLYPIYGCGDITQIFSRISSVYGSIFILDKEFEIIDYELQ